MAHGDITHVEIPVADFGRAKAFYGDLFGWRIEAPEGFESYPMWQAPNKISGGALVSPESTPGPRSYVEVDSIDATLTKAEAGGGSVLMPKTPITESSWFAILADPDGNQLGLFEGSM